MGCTEEEQNAQREKEKAYGISLPIKLNKDWQWQAIILNLTKFEVVYSWWYVPFQPLHNT